MSLSHGEESAGGPAGADEEACAEAATASSRGADALRWAICLAVAAACHGVAIWALLSPLSELSDDGIKAPMMVLLDLPESLTALAAPVQDLPPGPVEQEETRPAPPKEEDIKPPPPEAEAALPIPDPPKPEQPAAEKQAAAPSATRMQPSSVTRWQSLLAAHIEGFKRYPAEARSRREQGVARVAFTIDRQGRLLRSRIAQSSGSPALDQETLAMVSRAQPLPRPPDELSGTDLTFVLPIRFSIAK